jgi:phosphopantetheine--protein transferase-like protein
MVYGIGVDLVDVRELERLIHQLGDCFIEHTFTEKEVAASRQNSDPIGYLAERFAAKEAVFKAVAHLTKENTFDFRIVETLNREDGNPFIQINDKLQQILEDAGINSIMVSLSKETNHTMAMVIAQGG